MDSQSNKIVLGHPFSAALYAYFDKELNGGAHIKASAYHGYYKTLYGKHYESNIDMTLALSLIYDDIIVPGVDNPFPDTQQYLVGDEYYNPQFGLFFTYENEFEKGKLLDEQVQFALSDREVAALLWKIPRNAHWQLVREVFNELEMAKKFNAPLFSVGKRQAIARRISTLQQDKPVFVEQSKVQFVSDYLDITGLLFKPMGVESFYYLKKEKDLREYSSSFINVLEKFQPGSENNIKLDLLLLIKEAMNKDKLSSNIAGIFDAGSNLMNYVGLIPVVGTVASLTGIGANWASQGIEKWNRKNMWYELAANIEKHKSIEKIKKELESIK